MGGCSRARGSFISEKVNKIRWKPEDLLASEHFLTGSWGNQVNQLVLWQCSLKEESDDNPTKAAVHPYIGDVTELRFINNNSFVAASSLGSVKLFQLNIAESNPPKISERMSWDNLHYFKYHYSTGDKLPASPCSGLACFEDDFATVGEDGRIAVLTATQKKPLRVIDKADSCSLRCVCFLKHNSLLTGNLRGQMKVWDLKSPADKPASTFRLSGDQIGASCVTHHPTQRHLVLAGGEDGSLTVWDLRHNTFPVTLLSAHSATVSELLFHPDRPDHLFTCAASGEVWHWNTSSMTHGSITSSMSDESMTENPWLSSDAAKHRLEVFSLMTQLHLPINSLDVNKNRLICGCDNEAVYLIRGIDL